MDVRNGEIHVQEREKTTCLSAISSNTLCAMPRIVARRSIYIASFEQFKVKFEGSIYPREARLRLFPYKNYLERLAPP